MYQLLISGLVLVMGVLVVSTFVHRRKRLKNNVSKQEITRLTSTAATLAYYFGTAEIPAEEGQMPPRQAGERILRILESLPDANAARLRQIAQIALAQNRFPPPPKATSQEFRDRAQAIGIVCRDLRQLQPIN